VVDVGPVVDAVASWPWRRVRAAAELAGLPTLVVSAEHDRIAPPSLGRALAAGIPGARYVEIAGAAHGVTIQDPERINGLLREHLTGARVSWSSKASPRG